MKTFVLIIIIKWKKKQRTVRKIQHKNEGENKGGQDSFVYLFKIILNKNRESAINNILGLIERPIAILHLSW